MNFIAQKDPFVAQVLAILVMVIFSVSGWISGECREIEGGWPYGSSSALKASGGLIYFGNGTVFQIGRLSTHSEEISVLGETALPDTILDIAISGNLAFVAADRAGLRIVDISDPTRPVEIAVVDVDHSASAVSVMDGEAFLLETPVPFTTDSENPRGGLWIIDVTSPWDPEPKGIFEPSMSADGVRGMAVYGGLVYLMSSWRLDILDVTLSEGPREVGTYSVPGYGENIDIRAGMAYVLSSEGLFILNLSRPAEPVEQGFVDISSGREVAVMDDFAFVTSPYRLHIIDVGESDTPTEVGVREGYRSGSPTASGGIVYWLEGRWNYYEGGSRILALDTEGIGNLQGYRGLHDLPGDSTDVAVSGDAVFLVSRDGLRVFDPDLGNEGPWEPRTFVAGLQGYVIAEWPYAFMTGYHLRVMDFSDISSPVEMGRLNFSSSVQGLAYSEPYLVTAHGGGGLKVIDLSDKSNPVVVGVLESPGGMAGVGFHRDYVYAVGGDGFKTIDILATPAPKVVGHIQPRGILVDLAFAGDFAYLVDRTGSVRIIDISRPTEPREVGWIDFQGLAVRDVEVSGDRLFVAVDRFLVEMDISSPASSPVEIGRVETPGEAIAVAVSGDLVFVADGSAGLVTARTCSDSDGPENLIYVAAAAAQRGAGETSWFTDLDLNNSSDRPTKIRLQFWVRDTDNTGAAFSDGIILQPNSGQRIVDVWGQISGGEGAGSVVVWASDPESTTVTSRTYTITEAGTYGQTIEGVLHSQADRFILEGEVARLGFLTENDDFRTNIGLLNPGETPVEIRIQYFSQFGDSLGIHRVTIPPRSGSQLNRAFLEVTDDFVDLGYVEVWSFTDGARFLAFASLVDNRTGDPSTIWPYDTTPRVAGGVFECEPLWVAAAASALGDNASWSTDLEVNNLGSTKVTYRFQILPRGEDNRDAWWSDVFWLSGGSSVAYRDIWKSLTGTEGVGSINVCVDDAGAVGVLSRTYNTVEQGTYGQAIAGVPGTQPAKVSTGERVRLVGLKENEDFRTNIGFLNTSSESIKIVAEFYDEDGAFLGTRTEIVLPFSNVQWNKAFTSKSLDRKNIDAGFVDIRSDTPWASFLAYASVIDNGTGDPVTVWPGE